MEKANDCFDCKFYNASVGEKGYCTLYRHETVLPEIACIKYEKKQDEPQNDSFAVRHMTARWRRFINALMYGAFASCTVLTVISLMMCAYLDIEVFTIQQISPIFKILIVVLTAIFVLFMTHLLFILAKKYITARILELLLAIAVVIYILINYDTIWFDFTNFSVHLVDYVFKSFIS